MAIKLPSDLMKVRSQVSETAITDRHARGASISLKDTIRAFDRPSDQMNEDNLHECVTLEQERPPIWNHQPEDPSTAGHCDSMTRMRGAGSKAATCGHATLGTSQSPMSTLEHSNTAGCASMTRMRGAGSKAATCWHATLRTSQSPMSTMEHSNTAGDCASMTCTGRAASKPAASGHATLRTSQSPMSASTYTGLLHDLTYKPGASSSLAQPLMPTPSCTGLMQDLNDSLRATSETSGSAMPASTWTSPMQVLRDSLDHGILSSHGKSHEPAVSCGRCHEQPSEDSAEEMPNPSIAHYQRRQQPNAIHNRVGKITTLLIRNVPMKCTNTMLINELHSEGFQGVYNFFYRPIDHHTRQHRSCAFVNFVTPLIATALYLKMHGRFLKCAHDQEVPLEVVAAQVQGVELNAAHIYMKRRERHRRIRAQPIFATVQNSRVIEVEAHAKRLLLSDSTAPAVAAC